MKKEIKIIISLLCVMCIGIFGTVMTGCNENKDNDYEILQPSDGLSAYEIFCKHYIYIKSEKEWIDELVSGTLERIDNSVLEEKIYWQGNIDDDRFVAGEILLTVDKYFDNKVFTINDFHMIEVEKVELLMSYSTDGLHGGQIYLITLKNKEKQDVVKSIRKLEIFAFTRSAQPNQINRAI